MAQLYSVGNPIDREERANLNLTFDDIQRRFSLLQSQVNFLSGGADIEGLLNEINQAIINAQNSTENVDAALITIDNKLQELELELEMVQELKPLGEWNSTTNYKKLNIVYLDGNSYIAKLDNVNVNPSDTNTWTLFASKGDTGKGLSIKGSLSNPSQLPPASNYDEGDAFYVGQDLYVKIDNDWENVGQIKGDPGSDANVTANNIELALGYVPADKEKLDNFKNQYEFRTPTISGRQILISKPDDSNRIPILLSNEIVEGNKITVSTDSGSTSFDLKDIDGNDVTKLEKGFHELIYTGSFFTLRNLSGGVNQSQLDELIRLVNEAETNDSTLRSQYVSAVNSLLGAGTLSPNASWNEILLQINGLGGLIKRFKTGTVTAPTGAVAFQYYSDTTNATQFRAIVSDLGFRASHIIIVPTTLNTTAFVTEYYQSFGTYNEYIKQSVSATGSQTGVTNRGFKAQSQNAYVNETGFSLPVVLNGSYTYYAYE